MADLFECAYFAGLVDGEGYIGIRTVRSSKGGYRSFQVDLTVSNVDRRPLDKAVGLFGGSIQVRGATRTGKPLFMWRSSARIAGETLRTLLPFLIIKREQALIAVALQDRISERRRVPMTEGERGLRQQMQLQIREFNARRYFKPTLLDMEVG